jgi:SanA protein
VAIVLGASVVRGEPSPVLRERALAALELYRAGKVSKILVSGDDSVEGFDEVSPVRRLLQEEGVRDEDIFLDHAGFDTYSSMYRARDIFLVTDAVVVTQAFHLPRAVFIARRLGLEARGLVAPADVGLVDRYLREWGASLKAAVEITVARVPKYLGPQFPITGDVQETWE